MHSQHFSLFLTTFWKFGVSPLKFYCITIYSLRLQQQLKKVMWTVSLRYFKFIETVGRFQRQLVLKETRVFKAQSSRDNLPWGNFPGGNFCGICQGPIFQGEFFRGTVIPQGAIIQWEIFRGRGGEQFSGWQFSRGEFVGGNSPLTVAFIDTQAHSEFCQTSKMV